MFAGCAQELGAVGEKFRCAAFVVDDMGMLVADDAVIRLAARGEREGIGGRAVEDEENLRRIGFEKAAQDISGPFRPGIVAVGGGVIAVGPGDRLPGFGTDTGGIVAGEMGFGSRRGG